MKKERVTLKLPPENKWVPMLAETVRHYSSILDIPDVLCSMISESLIEACEELIRICNEQKMENDYEISLDFNSDAIIVQVIYDGKIPLHPQQTENYEVPDQSDDLDAINLDSLWLHLIKKRMDRVFFKVDGNVQRLQMMKYRRKAENPKQFWVMELAPKLKRNVTLEVQAANGASPAGKGAILQNKETGTLLKLDKISTFIVQRLDGNNTFQEIYMDYIDAVGMVSPQRMALIFEKLEQAEMLENSGDDNEPGILKKIINPNLTFTKADTAVSLVYKCCSFIFNPLGAVILMIIGLSGLIPLVEHFDKFKGLVLSLGDFYYNHPLLLLLVYLSSLLIVVIHEFGHGLVCKHYGGSIGRMGLMFYLTMFMFYCDTSSAWNFPSKKQRVMVSLGGPLTTFAILGVTLWLFGLYAGVDSLLSVFWGTLSIFCIAGLIMNMNPFIKMDAYYILMDLSGINNLQTRSFQFLKSKLFSKETTQNGEKQLTKKERVTFWLYGSIGSIVTVLFIILPLCYYSWQLLTAGDKLDKYVFAVIIIMLVLIRISHKALTTLRMRRRKVFKIS
jgi:putative peptide zinc metalloprotease protein